MCARLLKMFNCIAIWGLDVYAVVNLPMRHCIEYVNSNWSWTDWVNVLARHTYWVNTAGRMFHELMAIAMSHSHWNNESVSYLPSLLCTSVWRWNHYLISPAYCAHLFEVVLEEGIIILSAKSSVHICLKQELVSYLPSPLCAYVWSGNWRRKWKVYRLWCYFL